MPAANPADHIPKRPNKSEKAWRRAIELACSRLREDPNDPTGKRRKALRLVAEATVTKAINGDIAAAQEIGNRLDGKVTQSIDLQGLGDLIFQVTLIAPEPAVEADPKLIGSGSLIDDDTPVAALDGQESDIEDVS